MPEGDTIFRAAARMHLALAGGVVTRYEARLANIERDDIVGRKIEQVHAVGKHLLIEFEGGLALRTHLRMNGSWHLYRAHERWMRGASRMRIVIETEKWQAVGFSIPEASFTDSRRDSRLARLGPDLLSDEFDSDEAFRRLRARNDVPLAEALLDQQALAGIGNVFKSEILFIRELHPFSKVGSLDDETLRALIATSHELLQNNVVDLKRWSSWGGYRRTTHRSDPSAALSVYGRRGLPCRRCGSAIEYSRAGKNNRSTYWCPRCQPA